MEKNILEELSLQPLQKLVDDWIKNYGVRYFDVMTNTVCLMEEVGEVAHVVARKYGEQSFKVTDKDNLADELADVLSVLTAIANQTGVDLTAAFKANLEKKTQRDSERHKLNDKLHS